jgi:serine/threonine protein kinase
MLTTDPGDALVGRTIEGKYRIDARLGGGGTGTVYRAHRLLIGDDVAIKIIHPEYVSEPHAIQRFRRAAQAAARLKHPNAVSIYDFSLTSDGICYVVMELVEGQSVREIIRQQGPLTLPAASEIIQQVGFALDEAHRQHIVHRNLKPDSIFVNPTLAGLRVKVLGFEIASLRDTSTVNLSQAGIVIGTPYYMSPEQCLAEELDSRSDIYSLGIILYEMLAGGPPFHSPTSTGVVIQHVNQAPPSLRLRNPLLSPAIEAVVLHALAKRREDRPQTAHALATEFALAAFPEGRAGVSRVELERKPFYADNNVQFTVYAPQRIKPEKTYTLLAFAHLSQRRADADEDEPDPIEEMRQQAARLLGSRRVGYLDIKKPSNRDVPRGGELTFVPVVQGITFDPPSRYFTWRKSVHREEFDMWAVPDLDGQTLTGRLMVFLGSVIIAEVGLTIAVDRRAVASAEEASLDTPQSGRRLRQIFTSYSHKDEPVVAELAHVAPIFGARYLMDRTDLEPGEDWREGLQRLIRNADVFQLFWSTNSMRSLEVANEIDYAISLRRTNFILPTYWEEPLPRSPEEGLPPEEIDRLHFYRIYPGAVVTRSPRTDFSSYLGEAFAIGSGADMDFDDDRVTTVSPNRSAPPTSLEWEESASPTMGQPAIKAGIAIIALLGAIAALALWISKRNQPVPPTVATVNLSADDMSLIAADVPAEFRKRLFSEASARRDFAREVRELLAVAEEARSKGLADRPDLKRQLAQIQADVVSKRYFESFGGPTKAPPVSDAEIEALFKEPGMEELFTQFVYDNRRGAVGNQPPDVRQLRRGWGEAQIGERRGIAAGIDKQRRVELQIMVEQARLLASKYAQETLLPNAKASDAEIDAYIAQHPELDKNQARIEARSVIEQEKLNHLIEEITNRSQVVVSDTFRVDPPGR